MVGTVLITGCSSGIGKSAAVLFHRMGWNVIATMRAPDTEGELNLLDGMLVSRLDVTDKEGIKVAVKAGIDRFGDIDVLVNNAGYGVIGPLESISDDSIRREFDVNFFGVVDVIKAVLPHMRANKKGLIINVSSLGGRVTSPYSSIYCASKFAVEGLTEALQYELHPFGIKVKLIEPGAHKTRFFKDSMERIPESDINEYMSGMDKIDYAIRYLEGWAGKPEDVAKTIYKAATDGADRLRYPVGKDAEKLLKRREEMTDAEYKNMIAKELGLW